MKRVPKPRQSVSLSESLRNKVEMYGLAAVAAGFGVAALASPSQGEVVYTPANKEIGRSGVIIDLNHDGIADFEILARNFAADGRGVTVDSHQSNNVFGTSRAEFASMLPLGYTVGPNSVHFKRAPIFSSDPNPNKLLYYCQASSGGAACIGPWYKTGGVSGSYVGLRFLIDGQIHYGWARLKLEVTGRNFAATVYLTGYAYETVANKPIVTGKIGGAVESSARESEVPLNSTRTSAPLGMLSAGSSALPLWRTQLQ